MLRWPEKALGAIRTLFESLQDIDVYVEDKDDEVFYTHLLKRVCNNKIRIERVFAKGGRRQVTDAAKAHDQNKRRALFIIDGDLSWVLGEPPPNGPRHLFQLDAYCIENMIFGKLPITVFLMQEAVLTEDDAIGKIDFESWLETIQEPLVKLFAAFAVCWKYCPSTKTVAQRVGNLCNQTPSGENVLDVAKVERAREAALTAAEAVAGRDTVIETYDRVLARATTLKSPLDVVSGKDFLTPLALFRLQKHGCRPKIKSFRLKLALSCEIERFTALVDIMTLVAKGAI